MAKQINIIDPHLHLFNLKEGDYGWLKANTPPYWPDKEKINREFTENNVALSPPYQLAGYVHIEAGFDNNEPSRELKWLDKHCTLPFKSIAYIDLNLTNQKFIEQLNKLLVFKSFVGVRYILDECDLSSLFEKSNVIDNMTTLASYSLIFECQLSLKCEKDIIAFTHIMCLYPQLTFIINHAGFPPSVKKSTEYLHWLKMLTLMAQQKNCAIKCSGWEMISRQYQLQWQKHSINNCLDIFDTNRVMIASNFPLVTLVMNYQEYWEKTINNLSLTSQVLSQLTYRNSYHLYRF